MVTRFVGREPIFRGKTLYELCCNLKNFGEGRVVYRHIYVNFPETSYYRLTNVQPDMSDPTRQAGTAWAEKVYRGQELGMSRIDVGYKFDWFMVPKEDEAEFCKITAVLPKKEKPPKHFDCPPLLELLTRTDMKKMGESPSSDLFRLALHSKTHSKLKNH
ncbi:small ribosomal subunit protein mS34-like [Littorina saxatilis]|uniref:Uncharacterized protein n=1 Tax=Littorina saxatilis TaxID=31220 RepID=A0AAN9BF50_9CAEN